MKIRLTTQDEVKGRIVKIEKEKDNSRFMLLRISNGVEKLVNYRKIDLNLVWWEYNGLKAPNKAIYYDNGLSYVVRRKGGHEEKLLVKVLKQNEKYSIVSNYSAEELQELGKTAKEINSLKNIFVYDEIILNPKI